MQFSVRSTAGRGGRGSTRPPRRRISRTPARREAAATRGWRVGNPTWVGPSNGIRYRITRPGARSPRVVRPQPGAEDPAPRGRLGRLAADRAAQRLGRRRVDPEGTRRRTRRRSASRASTTRQGTNNYSPAQAAAIMRGIEVYHVKSNGWNDIGYNFLVDRYGTVYEGRYGGIDRNVIGAYARGFNTGSIGVAVIGTFSTRSDPGCGRDVAREAPRLAARPRPRRSRLDAHVRLGRQRALSRRRPRPPARRLGTPRHGADDLPRQPALREARHDRGEDAGDRAAEALRAEGDRRPRRPGAVPGPRLLGPRVEGDRHRRARAGARPRHREGPHRRLHLGRIARHRAGRHLADRRCRRHARVGHASGRQSSSPARSRSPVSPPTRPRSARTATARQTRPRSPTRRTRARPSP